MPYGSAIGSLLYSLANAEYNIYKLFLKLTFNENENVINSMYFPYELEVWLSKQRLTQYSSSNDTF